MSPDLLEERALKNRLVIVGLIAVVLAIALFCIIYSSRKGNPEKNKSKNKFVKEGSQADIIKNNTSFDWNISESLNQAEADFNKKIKSMSTDKLNKMMVDEKLTYNNTLSIIFELMERKDKSSIEPFKVIVNRTYGKRDEWLPPIGGRPIKGNDLRAYAAMGLGEIGDDKVLPILVELLKDEYRLVRIYAERYLKKITGVDMELEDIPNDCSPREINLRYYEKWVEWMKKK